MTEISPAQIELFSARFGRIAANVEKVIQGKREVIELVLLALVVPSAANATPPSGSATAYRLVTGLEGGADAGIVCAEPARGAFGSFEVIRSGGCGPIDGVIGAELRFDFKSRLTRYFSDSEINHQKGL